MADDPLQRRGRRARPAAASDLSGSLLRPSGNPDGLDDLSLAERFGYLIQASEQRWGRKLSHRQIQRDLRDGLGADGQPLAAPVQTVSASYLDQRRSPGWNPSLKVLRTLVAYFACLDLETTDEPEDEHEEDQETMLQVVAMRLPRLDAARVEAVYRQAAELIAQHRQGALPPNRLERGRGARGEP